ncbi:MAG: transketolase C-terminal domain-containing protein [Lachnospiraceae bacterium]
MAIEFMDPRKTFGSTVTDLAASNKDIVVLSADSGKSSGFGEFIKEYPERYFECGIMEQGVVGVASGLATTGKIPVFCAIAPFITVRPYEMLRNDIGYMRQNVKLVGRNGGISYSDLGATHHSLEDFAVMSMIPGMVVLAPQDPGEIIEAVKTMIAYKGPVYMRIGNAKIPCLFEQKEFVIGKGTVIKAGRDITIISTGSITSEVMKAEKMLNEMGIKAEIIGMPTVSPIDEDLIVQSVSKTTYAITVEEHYAKGGLSSAVLGVINKNRVHCEFMGLGIPHDYAANGDYEGLLEYYHLDAKGITETVKKFLQCSKG